jgi:hypothetical protein
MKLIITQERFEELIRILNEVRQETDRGVVVLLAADIDDALSRILEKHLLPGCH